MDLPRIAAVAGTLREGARFALEAHRAPTPHADPLVTVVIATYNRSDVLAYAVASALDQSHRALQVLVVGDGCTDDSERVVRAIGDPRVEWVGLPSNSGSQSAPNNAGLERAAGEFVAYLGHDDLWMPTHVARSVAALRSTGADLSLTGILGLGPPGSGMAALGNIGGSPGRSRWLAPSCAVHRRSAVDEVGEWRDFRAVEDPPDIEFLQRVGRAGRSVAFVPAVTVLKFPSAWERGSYLRRDPRRQADALRRSRGERLFLERELLGYWWTRRRGRDRAPELTDLLAQGPGERGRGWQVHLYREIRGLPPLGPEAGDGVL